MAAKTEAAVKREPKREPKRKVVLTDIEKAVREVREKYGESSLVRLGERKIEKVPVIQTGSIALDRALGTGGWPRGRIVEIYGAECVDADTFLHYEVRSLEGRRHNRKGGTIERLWHRFHAVPIGGSGSYQRQTLDAEFFVPSINEEGRVFQNRVVDVVGAGEKDCFEVQLRGGTSIIASAGHRFFVGEGEYTQLSDLEPGDAVFVHNCTRYRGRVASNAGGGARSAVYVRHHPVAPTKRVFCSIVGKTYEYKRLRRSRFVWEAEMNGLPPAQYRSRLDSGELEGLVFLRRDEHVHRDEDWENDALSNLEVLSAEEHGRLHALERHNNLRFVVVPDEVMLITPVGLRRTFDLCMASPANNYVANGIVVHNSGGKTTLTLHAMANVQGSSGEVAFVDAEHALDPAYAEALGVDVDKLLINQPDSGEQALDVVEALTRTGTVQLIVIDSVAALTPRAELEGEMGDSHMALQARLMSQALRKLAGVSSKTGTTIMFTNQVRDRIGAMYGPKTTTTGGNALKFYASVRVEVGRRQQIRDRDEVIGNFHVAKVVKNKLAPPFRECEFELVYGRGIDAVGDLINVALELHVIEQAGSWYSRGERRLAQGRFNLAKILVEDLSFQAEIVAAVMQVPIGVRS